MDKNELRKLAKAATPGPWAHLDDGDVYIGMNTRREYRITMGERYLHDCTFIAAASPTTIIALLDEIEAKDAEIAAMRPVVDAAVYAVNEDGDFGEAFEHMAKAVRAYEAKMKEVGDG